MNRQFDIYPMEWLQQQGAVDTEQEIRLLRYELCWFTAGEGSLLIDARPYPLQKDVVYWLNPGRTRQYCLEGDVAGYRMSFSPDFLYMSGIHSQIPFLLDSFDAGMQAPVIETDIEMQMEIGDIARKMQKEFSNYNLLRSEILSGLLNLLMIYCSRKVQSGMQDPAWSKKVELVRKFKALLKKNFITKRSVSDYASALCVTPNYLNRTIKKLTGFTASHHIQQQIILEAKRQAITSNSSMKEIAYLLGFDDLAHFSKFFKNSTGVSFTSYKRGLSVAI